MKDTDLNPCVVCGDKNPGRDYHVYYARKIRRGDWLLGKKVVSKKFSTSAGSVISYYEICGEDKLRICNRCVAAEQAQHAKSVPWYAGSNWYKLLLASLLTSCIGWLATRLANGLISILGYLAIVAGGLGVFASIGNRSDYIKYTKWEDTIGCQMGNEMAFHLFSKTEKAKEYDVHFSAWDYRDSLEELSDEEVKKMHEMEQKFKNTGSYL